jgi:hypothetical protein
MSTSGDFQDSVRCDGRADSGPGPGPGDSSADCRADYGDGGVKSLFPDRIYVGETWNQEVRTLRKNKPNTGSFSRSCLRTNTGKPRKTHPFSSCGKYAQLSPRLPKYGRIAPRIAATKGP